MRKPASVLILAAIALLGGCDYVATKMGYVPKTTAAFELQTKCADRATVVYKQGGYEDKSQGFANFYTNHWNGQLGKCFIQINSTSTKDDFASIDVFDAFEGKHYAAYIGHNVCDAAITNKPTKCQLDSGNIWFDGNDRRTPADYHVGFQGITVGPGVGDENTQKQFLEHIQPFMTE